MAYFGNLIKRLGKKALRLEEQTELLDAAISMESWKKILSRLEEFLSDLLLYSWWGRMEWNHHRLRQRIYSPYCPFYRPSSEA